jgi:hypothetical protein
MMMTTMLPSPKMGRATSATTVKPFKQQSLFQDSGGNNLEGGKWQMGRQNDCGWQTIDD